VFQDAGDGYGYREGASRTIGVSQDGRGVRLDIPPNRGYQRVGAIEFIGLEAAPGATLIDGKPVQDLHVDASTRRLRIALPDENVKQVLLAQ
jgi:alpha-glucosidase